MATVSVNVPAGATADVLASFQVAYPDAWTAAQKVGQTPAQFAQARVAAYVEDIYRAYKLTQVAPPNPAPAGVT